MIGTGRQWTAVVDDSRHSDTETTRGKMRGTDRQWRDCGSISGHSDTETRDGIMIATNIGQTVDNSNGQTAEDSSLYGDSKPTGGSV